MESQGFQSGTLLRMPQSAPAQRSQTSGFSPTRLTRMHDTLLRHVDRGHLPGLVALISRRGMEHLDAIGTLGFDRTAPMRRDTIFRVASVTKPITAVAAMILVEECKLRLDDPVDDFLPELANRKVLRTIGSELDDTVPATRAITLRDLLTYRSGYGEVAFLSPTCPLQRALIEARLPLNAWMFPGTHDDFMQCLGHRAVQGKDTTISSDSRVRPSVCTIWRSRSVSVTIPITRPPSTTGSEPIFRSTISRAATSRSSTASMLMAGADMTCLTVTARSKASAEIRPISLKTPGAKR